MSDYPKTGGDIRRDYLVNIADECKYPNLALAIALHPNSVCTAADFAGVSQEILVDFLLGKDELTWSEFLGLIRHVKEYSDAPVSADYLLQKELAVIDASVPENAERIARAVREVETMEHPFGLILDLLERRQVPVEAITSARRNHAQDEYFKYFRENKRRPRTKRLSALEEESEGGLEVEFVFGEEANVREEAVV